MEGIVRDPGLRIVSGPYKVVEHELNQLLTNYAVLVWNFAPIEGEMHVTAVLVHEREVRKMQLAMPAMGNARH